MAIVPPFRNPLRRFEVVDRSMTPTLAPGDYLLTTRWGRRRPGQIVVFEHPGRPGFWLVKRAEAIDEARMTVLSDAAHLTSADSRSFGPVPIAGSYRLLLRYRRGPAG